MADVKLNSLATKTNANAAAILVKDSATQNQGAEGWITKAQLNQIIRDEVRAQLSTLTSTAPEVAVFDTADSNKLKKIAIADFAKVVGGLPFVTSLGENNNVSDSYTQGIYYAYNLFTSKIGVSGEGMLITLAPIKRGDSKDDTKFQIYINYSGTVFCWRLFNWSSQTWTSWKDF